MIRANRLLPNITIPFSLCVDYLATLLLSNIPSVYQITSYNLVPVLQTQTNINNEIMSYLEVLL